MPIISSGGINRPSFSSLADTGYDIFLIAGQSNVVGWYGPIDPELDSPHPRIFQLTQNLQTQPAKDPLDHVLESTAMPGDHVGFGMSLAREHLKHIHPKRKILLIPCGEAGSGFSNNRWNPGDPLYSETLRRLNGAMGLQEAQGYKNQLIAIAWLQGEEDADAAMSASVYQGALDSMISSMRSGFTGNSYQSDSQMAKAPWLLGGLCPHWFIGNLDREAIQTVIEDTPNRVANAYYVDSVKPSRLLSQMEETGAGFDNVHYSASSQRALGQRYYAALHRMEKVLALPSLHGFPLSSTSFRLVSEVFDNLSPLTIQYKTLTGSSWQSLGPQIVNEFIDITGLNGTETYEFKCQQSVGTVTLESNVVRFDYSLLSGGDALFFYNFEGVSAGQIPDLSGSGNTGIVVGNVSFISTGGQTSALIPRDGSQNYMNPNGINMPISYTKVAKLKLNDSANMNRNVMSTGGGGAAHALYFADAGGDLELRAGNSDPNALRYDSQSFPKETPYTIATTYDALTNVLTLYVNGIEVDSATDATDVSNTKIQIGQFTVDSNTTLDGELEFAALFSRVLSPKEIRSLWSMPD